MTEETAPLPDQDLTWAALLGHWTEFAKSSLALPKDAEGDRWRAAVAPIIGLQAVTFALADLDRLDARGADGERAFGLDKAEVLIRRHAAELHELWRAEPLPMELVVLIEDARTAHGAARDGGLEWRVRDERFVGEHPADLVAAVLSMGFEGDLFVPVPGVILFRTCPAVFAREPDGGPVGEPMRRVISRFFRGVGKPERVPALRQAYRQFDFGAGGPVRDVVVPAEGTLPAGQPLLVPAIADGVELPVTLPPRRIEDLPDLPVVFEGDDTAA